MNKAFFADFILLSVALIWGTTFVVVQNAIDILPPHSFNGVRFTIASLSLLFIILIYNKRSLQTIGKKGWIAGIVLGVFLFGGYALQTVGLLYTTASRAGFITGLSVVLVPLLSIIFLKMIPKWTAVLGVVLAAIGLYFLTQIDISGFQFGDFLVFLCAIFFALQIVFTGKFAPQYAALPLAWIQITVVAVLSFIFAILTEDFHHHFKPSQLMVPDVFIALLITAFFATALAYLAQTVFQRYTTPTRVAIIYAMEPVFAALTSFVVLHERLSLPSIIGGILIFTGMILAEIPSEIFSSLFRMKQKKPKYY